MSIAAASAVLDIRDPSLTVAERHVLLIYAVRARDEADQGAPLEAWPTAVRLAQETGLTREHVQRCRTVLANRNLIRPTGRKRGRSDVYQVNLRLIRHLCADITPSCDVTSQSSVMSHHTERKGIEQGKEQPPIAPQDDPDFLRFYERYPRHTAKGAALRAWAKAVKLADPEVIIAGAERYRDDPNRDDSFTAYPATWLNAGRWDDDPLPRRIGRGGPFKEANTDHWASGGEF